MAWWLLACSPVKLCGRIRQGQARPAFDAAAKWPILALFDKQDAVGVEIAVEVWRSMREAMGMVICCRG